MELSNICEYSSKRIDSSLLTVENYVSTENMMQNKGGITLAAKVPVENSVEFLPGDILISNIRPYFRKIWLSDKKGGCSSDVLCIRALPGTDSTYLYYLLSQDSFFDYVMSGAKGCKMPRGDKSQIMQWDVDLPNFEEQHRIASILKSIDDKIQLNNRINHNLEEQIQTLYREWFIDNPKTEWATIALSEVATFVSGYSYKGNEIVDFSETAMATIKNFERNGGFKLDGYKPISPSSNLKEEQYAELFDILVAHTDLTQNAEVIGNAEIILSKDSYSDIIFSMDLVKVVAKESFPYQFLLALLLKNPIFKSHCIGYVNGTTVLHMNKRALPDFNTQIPTCEDADRMNEIAKSIFTKMYENLCEIANLTKLRDSLLPKLMSGELRLMK